MNTDGTLLMTLEGYHLRYSTNPRSLGQSVTIPDSTVTTYTVSELTPGVWYFAVTAYSRFGTESALSNVASKTIH